MLFNNNIEIECSDQMVGSSEREHCLNVSLVMGAMRANTEVEMELYKG